MRFFFVIQFERQILACFIPSVFHYKIMFYNIFRPLKKVAVSVDKFQNLKT